MSTLNTTTELPISSDLQGVVLQCLAKKPEHRPQSALELARALPVLPTPTGENVVIITGAGGSGVLLSDACYNGGLQLMEAGTGVGKSFAYLVPALAWARTNQERTVVSTNTINLQEQLVGKDLPQPEQFRYEVAPG